MAYSMKMAVNLLTRILFTWTNRWYPNGSTSARHANIMWTKRFISRHRKLFRERRSWKKRSARKIFFSFTNGTLSVSA